jgi:hypothetical protein
MCTACTPLGPYLWSDWKRFDRGICQIGGYSQNTTMSLQFIILVHFARLRAAVRHVQCIWITYLFYTLVFPASCPRFKDYLEVSPLYHRNRLLRQRSYPRTPISIFTFNVKFFLMLWTWTDLVTCDTASEYFWTCNAGSPNFQNVRQKSSKIGWKWPRFQFLAPRSPVETLTHFFDEILTSINQVPM